VGRARPLPNQPKVLLPPYKFDKITKDDKYSMKILMSCIYGISLVIKVVKLNW